MDTLKPEIARLIVAKEQRRRKLAAFPFAEKVRMVVNCNGWRRLFCGRVDGSYMCGRLRMPKPLMQQ